MGVVVGVALGVLVFVGVVLEVVEEAFGVPESLVAA